MNRGGLGSSTAPEPTVLVVLVAVMIVRVDVAPSRQPGGRPAHPPRRRFVGDDAWVYASMLCCRTGELWGSAHRCRGEETGRAGGWRVSRFGCGGWRFAGSFPDVPK